MCVFMYVGRHRLERVDSIPVIMAGCGSTSLDDEKSFFFSCCFLRCFKPRQIVNQKELRVCVCVCLMEKFIVRGVNVVG